jgi:2-oxoglutarate ferredoxin oxidoreductase subunit gamma
MTIKIVIAGEGGQGVQFVGEVLAWAAHGEGMEALYIPNFGIEQRGGVSLAYVQLSGEQIGSPKFRTGEAVIALSERAVSRTKQYVGRQTTFIYDNSLLAAPQVADETVGLQSYDSVAPEAFAKATGGRTQQWQGPLPEKAGRIIGLPAARVARQELHPRVFNTIILGAAVSALRIVGLEAVKSALEAKLGEKFAADPELRELNYLALERGAELATEAQEPGRKAADKSFRNERFEAPKAWLYISSDLCKGCGLCREKCPAAVLDWSDRLGVYGTPSIGPARLDQCIACGLCQLVCPDAAILVERKKKTAPLAVTGK